MNATGTEAGTDELKRQLRVAHEERETYRAEADRLRGAVEKAASELEALRQAIRLLQERLEMVEKSISFRLGHALVLGEDPGVRVADVEALLPLMDAERSGRPVALAKNAVVGDVTEALTWDGATFEIAPPGQESDNVLVMADPPSGLRLLTHEVDPVLFGAMLVVPDSGVCVSHHGSR